MENQEKKHHMVAQFLGRLYVQQQPSRHKNHKMNKHQ